MEKLKRKMEFLMEIDKLKNIFRQSMLTDNSRNENDAEHSWHIAMYAIVLIDYAPKDIDILKVLKMCLIHDIVEIYAGDTFLYDEELTKTKKIREEEAGRKIFGILPEDMADEFYMLWQEFEDKKTKEAIYSHMLDRLEPIMLNYATKGGSWQKHNVTKDMVLSRLDLVLKTADDSIKNFILELLEDSVKKGYLKE